MIKCDFCVIPWYDDNGKFCFSRNNCDRSYCYDAIQRMTDVMKEDFKTRNSRNINNNYNYKGKKK